MSTPVIEEFVTVVVTTFERNAFLDETLMSLAKQTVPVQQVVVIDDGGTGSAKSIVEKYGDRFQYVWQSNSGQQRARNTGASLSKGAWIAFLDDDDLWEVDRNERIESVIRSNAVDFIFGDFSIFDETGVVSQSFFSDHGKSHPAFWNCVRRAGEEPYTVIERVSPLHLLPETPVWGAMTAIRRTTLTTIGGWDESLRGVPSEDLDFVFRALTVSRVGVIWSPSVRYRSHPNNVSRDPLVKLLGRVEIVRRLIEKGGLEQSQVDCMRSFIDRALRQVLWSCFRRLECRKVILAADQMGWSCLGVTEKLKTTAAKLLYQLGMSRD